MSNYIPTLLEGSHHDCLGPREPSSLQDGGRTPNTRREMPVACVLLLRIPAVRLGEKGFANIPSSFFLLQVIHLDLLFSKICYNFLKYEAFQRNKIHELLKCIIQLISKIEQLILLDYKGLLEASPFCLS